jgi:ADP-ribosyl-[dinitrogen reductase] hydrolase
MAHAAMPDLTTRLATAVTPRERLAALLAYDAVRATGGPWVDRMPSGRVTSWNRVEGMLLGLAIGDSLGNTSEGLAPQSRRELFGEIRDFLPHRHAGNQPVGLPSDDSQMAFWTLDELTRHGELIPERLAARFVAQRIFGIGSSVRQFVSNHAIHQKPWHESGPESAGNGALMRIAPIIVPLLAEPSPDMWADAALATMVTHNDSAAIASSVAFVDVLWQLLQMKSPPEPAWFATRFVEVCRTVETEAQYSPRFGAERDWSGRLSDWTDAQVTAARGRGYSLVDAQAGWGSGAYLLETVPSVLYTLELHADDPEEAIVRAVNDTLDNDTVGAIVGAAVGALHGAAALPKRWKEGLTGRTGADDDGAMFRILEQARERFWKE